MSGQKLIMPSVMEAALPEAMYLWDGEGDGPIVNGSMDLLQEHNHKA